MHFFFAAKAQGTQREEIFFLSAERAESKKAQPCGDYHILQCPPFMMINAPWQHGSKFLHLSDPCVAAVRSYYHEN